MFSHHKRHHNRRDELLMNKHGPRINQTIFLKKKTHTKEIETCPTQFVYTLPRKQSRDLTAIAKLEFSNEKFYLTKEVYFRIGNQLSKKFDPCWKFLKTTKGSWSASILKFTLTQYYSWNMVVLYFLGFSEIGWTLMIIIEKIYIYMIGQFWWLLRFLLISTIGLCDSRDQVICYSGGTGVTEFQKS